MNQEEKNIIRWMLVTYKNPYPKDIFQWDNKKELEFNRGRFNQHCYEIVENMRNDLLKQLDEPKLG